MRLISTQHHEGGRAAADPVPSCRGIKTFAEPCAGDGDLVRHLEGFGLRCTYSGDIRTGQDALERDHYGAIDAIITNPPYTRDVLHRLIPHFQSIALTWLLLPADFASTLQAVPFLAHCSDIVTIGRVKWFEHSKYTSKDNFAWYRFDARHKGVTAIHRRNQGEVIPSAHWNLRAMRQALRTAAIQRAVLLAGVQAARPPQEA